MSHLWFRSIVSVACMLSSGRAFAVPVTIGEWNFSNASVAGAPASWVGSPVVFAPDAGSGTLTAFVNAASPLQGTMSISSANSTVPATDDGTKSLQIFLGTNVSATTLVDVSTIGRSGLQFSVDVSGIDPWNLSAAIDGVNFTLLGAAFSAGWNRTVFDLSGSAFLDNQPNVTFRLLATNPTNAFQVGGLDNIAVTYEDGVGGSQGTPIPPGVGGPPWSFPNAPSGWWYDPVGASGFLYETDGLSNFTDVGLPVGLEPGGDGMYTVSSVHGDVTLSEGTLHSFPSPVQSFSIIGIDPPVDGNDPLAFPTFLEFDQMTGNNFTMTPIPEPSTFTLAALGLMGLLAYGWRGRRRA